MALGLVLVGTQGAIWGSIGILVLTFLTDLLDGFLARRWEVTSELGYLLDGVGDRASYLAALFICAYGVDLSLLVAYLVFFRDIALYAYRAFDDEWSNHIDKTRFWTKSYAFFLKAILIPSLVLAYMKLLGFLTLSPALQLFLSAIYWVFILYSYLSLWMVIRLYRS